MRFITLIEGEKNKMNDKKGLHMNMISYEIKNAMGNPFTIIFGIFFPILMSIIIGYGAFNTIPVEYLKETRTQLFITMSLIIPMAVILLGHSATYSQELEKDIPLRIQLFGYGTGIMILYKIIAHLIFLTVAILIFGICDAIILDINLPTFYATIVWLLSLYVIGAAMFMLAHGFAMLFKKFGPTYAVTMTLYFFFMFFSGMMGVQVKDLPDVIQPIAKLLPMSYMSRDFGLFWQGGTYNFMPFIQSMLFFISISGIILFFSVRKSKLN